MAEGIRDKVAIIGMGCTQFGERWDMSAEDLIIEAYNECLEDSGIDKNDIEAAWLGTCYSGLAMGKSAISLGLTLKLPFIPISRVENFCGTATESFKGACYAVAAGVCDIALAVGVEKLKDTGYGGLPVAGAFGAMEDLRGANNTAPGLFAQLASAYSAKYGLEMDKIKDAIAHISAKSHANGAMNPRAHLRKAVPVEVIKKSPMIAYPLGLFDCCGVSDGAAAAIVTTPEIAKKLKPNQDIVTVKSIQAAVSSGEEASFNTWDGAGFMTTQVASKRAYKEAGIEDPREEISMMEVHDCFSITEFVTMEDLHVSPKGGAYNDIMDGFYDLDGQLPCQPDGGLKCFGHPVGASGLRMIFSVYEQILARVPEERQVKDVRLGLTHNLGGLPHANICTLSIIGRFEG
jgi:acetyl-CoA C-acetyltransferase